MMASTREKILARLLVVGAGLAGIVTAARNAQVAEDWAFPAFQLLDADAQADEGAAGRGRPASAPNLVAMSPEMYLILGADPENVGTLLNLFEARLIKAVLTDTTLASLVGDNGEIRYEGSATGLARGRTMLGEMGVSFTFVYPLNPAAL